MTDKSQYVKVLSNTDKGICLEYLPSGQVVTLSKSYLNQLSLAEALKIFGIS